MVSLAMECLLGVVETLTLKMLFGVSSLIPCILLGMGRDFEGLGCKLTSDKLF